VKVIIRKIIISLIAGAMLAVSAGVLVVSAAFALFALLQGYVGGPGAAALTALAAAALMAVVAFSFEAWAKSSKKAKPGQPSASDQDLLARLIGMAQDKPVIAAGALAGAVFLAIRNPALTAIVVKAFLDPKPRPAKRP
jgi:hypothetical protein